MPPLPDDEAATGGLTVRQLVEKHSQRPEVRDVPRADRPVRLRARRLRRDRPPPRQGPGRPADRHRARSCRTAPRFDGLDGLRDYLLTKRREAVVRQFCRKLLGYALGRGVQLSDEPLLDEMPARSQPSEYRVRRGGRGRSSGAGSSARSAAATTVGRLTT